MATIVNNRVRPCRTSTNNGITQISAVKMCVDGCPFLHRWRQKLGNKRRKSEAPKTPNAIWRFQRPSVQSDFRTWNNAMAPAAANGSTTSNKTLILSGVILLAERSVQGVVRLLLCIFCNASGYSLSRKRCRTRNMLRSQTRWASLVRHRSVRQTHNRLRPGTAECCRGS